MNDGTRNAPPTPATSREGGYAMITATIFVLVTIVASMGVFSMTSTESMSSSYAQESTEALFLADAAVERARARLSDDSDWRDGWNSVSLGNGTYSLTLADTTLPSGVPGVNMTAVGRVGRAARAVAAVAELPASGDPLAVLVERSASIFGSAWVYDRLHCNGSSFTGFFTNGLRAGELTDTPYVAPPMIYTEADRYPATTYYDVRCYHDGGSPRAVVLDGDGAVITASLGTDLSDVVSYSIWLRQFSISFTGTSRINSYFDEDTGCFRKAPGDSAVVVMFGNPPVVAPSGARPTVDVYLTGSDTPNQTPITQTLINTRYTGAGDANRLGHSYWTGGLTYMAGVVMEPENGIGLVCKNHYVIGGDDTYIGTPANPALVYNTGSEIVLWGDLTNEGATIALNIWTVWSLWSNRSAEYYWNNRFLQKAPFWLASQWPGFGSSTLNIASWREIPSPGS
ncbi:hypothetical protein KDK88_02690 [bacterium]|nr:hypothetical protein [bacterium]